MRDITTLASLSEATFAHPLRYDELRQWQLWLLWQRGLLRR